MLNLSEWSKIAREVGATDELGNEVSSSSMVSLAIEKVLSQESLKKCVHYYIQRHEGYELLRGVLWTIRPLSAMEECYAIFRSAGDIQSRRSAIELLRVIADERTVPWIEEFLNDEDGEIQVWAACILDQLVFAGICELNDLEKPLKVAQKHQNKEVRRIAEEVSAQLVEGEKRSALLQKFYQENGA